MKYKDFIFLNVARSLQASEHPYTGRQRRLASVYCGSLVNFFNEAKLLKHAAPASGQEFEKLALRISDFTEEGQDFVMLGATDKWLAACDRKSNALLAKGATEEERLKVYADNSGLLKRLAKFRETRS
jgi:hypothetical protein